LFPRLVAPESTIRNRSGIINAMQWLSSHLDLVVPLVVSALGVWWLMPQRRSRPKVVGLLLSLCGFVILEGSLSGVPGPLTESVLFTIFAIGAVLCGVLMVTCRNPVYGALWFALATLSTCGLFLLQSAPFLAAATIVVYAGAIIVTFLFVIMLAQQHGATAYDQQASQPFAATVGAFVLLGALLATLQNWSVQPSAADEPAVATVQATASSSNPLSQPAPGQTLGTMNGLGRSLFGDYLFAVELAGSLLLIACIGAIAIAPRRAQGTL